MFFLSSLSLNTIRKREKLVNRSEKGNNLSIMMSEIERSSFDDENSISSSYGTTSILLLQVGFPFPSEEEENIREMIDRERQHSPRDDYLERLRSGDLDFNVRNQALDSILKVRPFSSFFLSVVVDSILKLSQMFSVRL